MAALYDIIAEEENRSSTMRILLAHNSLYFPSYGGGDKSNRLLTEALVARGHSVRVIARVEQFGQPAHDALLAEFASRGVQAVAERNAVHFQLNRVEIRVLTRDPHLRGFFTAEKKAFDPDVILTSTDDPAHLMLASALRAARARVVYLVRATIALPFGPDGSFPSATKTAHLRQTDGMVAVSSSVAEYARKWGGMDAVHVPISLLESSDPPCVGRFDNRFVTMINPCAGKGISIFLALAERFPNLEFAAIPTWGTTVADLAALRRLPNVTVFAPVDDIHELFSQTRIALVPSLWAEARSRVILEAMLRGIPVMASDVGGLSEAMLGVDYLLPVNPVVRYRSELDELMVPMADIPEQNVEPWYAVLQRLTTDRAHYTELSATSRKVARAYASNLNVLPFEAYLEKIIAAPKRREHVDHGHVPVQSTHPRHQTLSPEKRRLLALRLQRKKTDPCG